MVTFLNIHNTSSEIINVYQWNQSILTSHRSRRKVLLEKLRNTDEKSVFPDMKNQENSHS